MSALSGARATPLRGRLPPSPTPLRRVLSDERGIPPFAISTDEKHPGKGLSLSNAENGGSVRSPHSIRSQKRSSHRRVLPRIVAMPDAGVPRFRPRPRGHPPRVHLVECRLALRDDAPGEPTTLDRTRLVPGGATGGSLFRRASTLDDAVGQTAAL